MAEPRRALVPRAHHPTLKRGSFANVDELVDAIDDYIAHHNNDPKPFVWTKTADEIIAKVRRGRVALEQARAKSRTHH